MVRRRLPAVLILCAASCLTASASAQAPAEGGGNAASVGDAPALAKKPAAKKPAAGKPAAKKAGGDGLSLPNPVSASGVKRETSPKPRRIDPNDIDDPYGGVGGASGSRVTPMMTPTGRAGVGGRF
jgi:hypothetical protein